MSIKVGVCGTGAFADCFIPLIKAHPEVSKVILCDLDQQKLKEKAKKWEIKDTCPSLEELCQTDVDAIFIYTQNDRHGPQAIHALNCGKHVYSAVPSAITMEEISELVKTVESTGQVYMIGETSYYYPCAIYCRERFKKGDFGEIVYSEGEYIHDFSHGLYDVSKWRFGKDWEKHAGSPPMFYPTHSVSMVVSVTGAYATHVSGMGFVDKNADNLFGKDKNIYHNPFSNETALCKMSDGSVARFNEFRRAGHPGAVSMSMFGTKGSYEQQYNSHIWVTAETKKFTEISDLLNISNDRKISDKSKMVEVKGGELFESKTAQVHPIHLLPKEYSGLPNGHSGSHQFLIHEFVTACVNKTQPINNVWQAARYLVPGLIAHESAMRGGVLLEVPDFGSGK